MAALFIMHESDKSSQVHGHGSDVVRNWNAAQQKKEAIYQLPHDSCVHLADTTLKRRNQRKSLRSEPHSRKSFVRWWG